MSKCKIDVAVVCPSYLPIPAVSGGAVETLIDNLIYENETKSFLNITVFSTYNKLAKQKAKELKQTKVVYIKESFLARVYSFFRNVKKKFFKKDMCFSSYFLMKSSKNIRKMAVDFVIVEGNYLVGEYLKKNTKKKLIIHLHNELHASSYRAEAVARSTDYFFTVSNYISSRLLEISSIKADNVFLIHNCTNTDIFNKDLYLDSRKLIREKFNVKNDDILLIYSGRIVEEKGVLELVQAVLSINMNNVKLMIVGSPFFDNNNKTEYLTHLGNLISNAEGRIFFTGFINYIEMPKYYSAADIAIIPSIWEEPAGLTCIEAQASGIPLIATDSGGIKEYADSSVIIIDKNKDKIVDELVRAITDLATDHEKMIWMGISEREHIKQYSQGNYYNEYVNALIACLKGGKIVGR